MMNNVSGYAYVTLKTRVSSTEFVPFSRIALGKVKALLAQTCQK